jgi:uncharacterized protein (TIGR02996 family)
MAAKNAEQAFIQAICEAPEDDAPRLVFADWLDDNGDPDRAEFIRTQCRRASMDVWDDERDDLVHREKQLLKKHQAKWAKPTNKFTKRAEFHRGFVGEMAMAVPKFLSIADTIFAATPLTILRPMQVRPSWDALVASEHLSRLRELNLYVAGLGVARTRSLAECEHLANLHELNVEANHARRGLGDLVRSPHLGSLRRLRMRGNEGGDDLAAAMAEAKPMPDLRTLDVAHNGVTADGARRIARAGWLSQLERLGLEENPIGDDGLEALADSDVWLNQRTLLLYDCQLGERAGRLLAGCRRLSKLQHLSVSIQDDQLLVSEIAGSPYLSQLRSLSVKGKFGSDVRQIDALVRSPLAANLSWLRLPALSPEAVRILLTARSLSGLRLLDVTLGGGPADGEVGKLLREATHLSHVRTLRLECCRLGDTGLAAIADSPHLGNLRSLDVSRNSLSGAGLTALADSPHFNHLQKLSILYAYGEGIDEGKKRLRERYGDALG